MAKRYVLGPNAARKLTELLRGSGEVSRRPGATAGLAFDSEYVAPFTVQWAQSVNGGDGSWIIWLPADGLLTIDGEPVDVTTGLTAAGGDYPEGWYSLDSLGEDIEGVWLNVRIPDESDDENADDGTDAEDATVAEDDADEDETAAEFAASPSEDEGVLPVHVARIAGKSVVQLVSSSLILNFADGVPVDEDSIGRTDGVLQVAHFHDSEQDSSFGIAKRLKANPETGEISAADDSGLMLLARKDGRIIYVPLDGSGDDPESPEDGKKDPCDHDASGSGGGVVAGAGDDAIPHGGGVAAGGGGGVSPGSATDTHTGDDDCNCN